MLSAQGLLWRSTFAMSTIFGKQSPICVLVLSHLGRYSLSVIIFFYSLLFGVVGFVHPSFHFVFWLSRSSHSRQMVISRPAVDTLTVLLRFFSYYFRLMLFYLGLLHLQPERVLFLALVTSYVWRLLLYTALCGGATVA